MNKSPLLDFLGRLLFPELPPWLQRKNAKILLGTVLAGILVGGLVVLFMLLQNKKFGR